MSKNLQSPTKLTEFAPLQPEEKQDTVGQLFSRIFSFGKSSLRPEQATPAAENADNISQESLPSWATMERDEASDTVVYDVDVAEGRSLPSVLKRISNLLAHKSNNFQAYSDSELKQYWMPDSVSKECYECCEKFTTFRRRHHCRVCGQIFCSSCCNQQIPGKIFGCTGDLRVCTYCCKVVLSYLQSNDIGSDLTADLRALQENLQSKYGDISSSSSTSQSTLSPSSAQNESVADKTGTIKRKISVGYQEEKFASGRGSSSYLTSEEKCRALQNSASLRNLYEEICRPNGGISLRKQRYRLRTYVNTFLGSELVEWLIYQQKANTRVQAAAFCQALLDGGYIICLADSSFFIDGNSPYKIGVVSSPEVPQNPQNFETAVQDEPIWVQNIPQDSNNTDSENEQISPSTPHIPGRIPSSSSYTLDLNVGANTVYLSKPPAMISSTTSSDDFDANNESNKIMENVTIRTSQQHEKVPESGWHNATQLREENGESEAYKLLTSAFDQHENTLVRQLLSVAGLSLTWSNIIMPLIHEIVEVIRPDINHNAEELDIRNYIQFKKLTGGSRSDCQLIRGIVFTKNVAHKAMSCRLENPKILLLECAIVYQRTEGRLMSLDPVLMQEQQFLTHVADRILALKPDIVLVHRNMSRLAQDILRKKGVTIVLNVKQSVLERIARCTDADLVSSIDARISAPRLGTCKTFYLKNFDTDRGGCKTLMFFEGLSQPHLGATVLLRGASKSELLEIKSVASFLLFTCYNWRLEKSFLMDEFAYPRVVKDEFFNDSKENSPISPVVDVNVQELNKQRRKMISSNVLFGSNDSDTEYFNSTRVEKEMKNKIEEKKSVTEPIQDFSDPLHSYNVDDVFNENTTQKMSVADLPFSNQFRKALDDTILCISPYLVFSVPYLETENGRKCKLRNYFPTQIYHSEQFMNSTKKKLSKDMDVCTYVKNEKNMKSPHVFVIKPISASIDSNEVQSLLTHFRACGGRFPKKPLLDITPIEEINKERPHEDGIDVLNPRNHQRMAVLFCSFSKESINAPAFCVNPWVVYMAFYGQNDIPLGCFLMRYCFSPYYHCQSKCETPMLKHVRKFVHYTGCVCITLNHIDTLSKDEDIIMWSWCSKCQQVSPMVKMSVDTWSFSFAKYLELRFHAGLFSRRGNSHCQHSLHHDHHQYFSYKNTVASFRYTSIDLWEISLPPTILEIKYNNDKQYHELMDEIKSMSQNGHEMYSNIQDKLALLPSDHEMGNTYKELLAKEHQIFKQKIEEIQIKLTSPSIEKKNLDEIGNSQAAMWKIHDGIVRIKRIIVEAVDQWNAKLSESITHKKEDKKKDKTSSQELDSPNTSTDTKNSSITSMNAPNSELSDSEIINLKNDARTTKKNRSLDKPDDDDVSSSPRGHHRSQSDGTVLNQIEDIQDGRKESEKKSVKTIFSLFSSAPFTPIANPFNSEDHYSLPSGLYAPIAVYESEPSSMIAYALNSPDYKKQFDGKKTTEQSPSPLSKRRSNSEKSEELTQSIDKSSSIKLFFRSKDSKSDLLASTSTNADVPVQNEPVPIEKTSDSNKNNKIEVQFEDNSCKFCCIVYHAEKFDALRKLILPEGEEAYIRSLSRCVPWDARGGKSGSTFRKTMDDRFIIKAMPQKEIQLFLDSAHNYFAYMTKCFTSGQPTLLGKIVGLYQIVYKNTATNASLRTFLLVMENLFYNRVVTQKFDLKGSMRNRLVNPDNQDGEIVLLDENLLKMTCENPLYIYPHSKAVLTAAIQNDTEFLSNQCVMDYSLLVGLDSEKKELVLGIIDYIRTFTWDKKLETIVKKTGILGGQGKLPTIMPPQEYQKRFIEAMHRYFLEVPDPWVGMDRGLDT